MRTQRGDWLLWTAVACFAIGVLAMAALFITPAIDDGATMPTAVYLLTTGAPIGFVLGLIFALRSGRRHR